MKRLCRGGAAVTSEIKNGQMHLRRKWMCFGDGRLKAGDDSWLQCVVMKLPAIQEKLAQVRRRSTFQCDLCPLETSQVSLPCVTCFVAVSTRWAKTRIGMRLGLMVVSTVFVQHSHHSRTMNPDTSAVATS
ncbi:hypothetical protein O3P69_017523 [Scylla paramamosain]|uniref:Uncharacterized protein n=2 Tax=Scylla paramamosain TaxID=85552 RepID=A0AAW0TW61_SCYPA